MRKLRNDTFQSECRDFFLVHANLDLADYRDETTNQFDDTGMMCIDWNAVSIPKRHNIYKALQIDYCPYKIMTMGSWMMCFVTKEPV